MEKDKIIKVCVVVVGGVIVASLAPWWLTIGAVGTVGYINKEKIISIFK